jgi:hypothetical protein
MSRVRHRLTDLAIRNAKPRLGPDGLPRTTLLPDGDGLYAQLNPNEASPQTDEIYSDRLGHGLPDGIQWLRLSD